MTKLKRIKNKQSGYTLTELLILLGVVAWAVAVVAIIYVLHHFIVKYW